MKWGGDMDKHKLQRYQNMKLEAENNFLREDIGRKDEIIKGYEIYGWLSVVAMLVMLGALVVVSNG